MFQILLNSREPGKLLWQPWGEPYGSMEEAHSAYLSEIETENDPWPGEVYQLLDLNNGQLWSWDHELNEFQPSSEDPNELA